MNVCYMIILNKLYLPSVLSNLRYHPLVPVISLQKSYVRRIAPLPIAEFSFEQRGNPICGPVPFPEFDCGETSTCADTVELPGVAGLHKNKDTACNAKEVPILRAQPPPPAKQNIMKINKNYNSIPPFNLNQGMINEKNSPMKPLKETPSHEQIDNSIPKILFRMKPTLSNIRNPFLIDDFTRFTHRYKLPQRVSIKNSLLYKAGLHPRVTEFKFDETFESTTLGYVLNPVHMTQRNNVPRNTMTILPTYPSMAVTPRAAPYHGAQLIHARSQTKRVPYSQYLSQLPRSLPKHEYYQSKSFLTTTPHYGNRPHIIFHPSRSPLSQSSRSYNWNPIHNTYPSRPPKYQSYHPNVRPNIIHLSESPPYKIPRIKNVQRVSPSSKLQQGFQRPVVDAMKYFRPQNQLLPNVRYQNISSHLYFRGSSNFHNFKVPYPIGVTKPSRNQAFQNTNSLKVSLSTYRLKSYQNLKAPNEYFRNISIRLPKVGTLHAPYSETQTLLDGKPFYEIVSTSGFDSYYDVPATKSTPLKRYSHRTKLFKVQFRAGLSQEVDSRTSSTLPPNKDPNSTKSTSASFDFIRCQKLAKCNMLDWQNDTVAPPQPQLQLQPKILNIH